MQSQRLAQLSSLLELFTEFTDDIREAELNALQCRDPELAISLRRLLLRLDPNESDTWLQPGGALRGALGEQAFKIDGPDLKPGTLIGRYRIESLLGQGGSGKVYRASREFDGFQQHVALKLMAADTKEISSGSPELRALARLEHPNIARFLDAGLAAGYVYLAMELIEGVPITVHAHRSGATLERKVDWAIELCEALAHSHSQLIVHCDIKPNNVLVDARGTARLLDFGIANFIDTTSQKESERRFTPTFATPEQVLGAPLSTATDVFQVGALLYQLLTGESWLKHPERARQCDYAEIINASAQAPSKRLLSRVEARHRLDDEAGSVALHDARRIAGDLDSIVLRCLNQNPSDRYKSMAILADDLRAWRSSRPISSISSSRTHRVRLWARRNAQSLTIAATAAIALFAVAALFGSKILADRRERQEEETRAAISERFLMTVFQQAAPYATRGSGRSLEFVRIGDSLLGKASHIDALTRARVSVGLARIEIQQGAHGSAQKRLRALWNSSVTAQNYQQDAQLANALGEALLKDDKVDEAISVLASTRVQTAVSKADVATRIAVGSTLAVAYQRKGLINEASRTFADMRDELLAGDALSQERLTALRSYARFIDQGSHRYDDLAPVLEELSKPMAISSPVSEAERLNVLSYVELVSGNPVASGGHAAQSAKLLTRYLSDDHPKITEARTLACNAYFTGYALIDAERECLAAYRILERAGRIDSDSAAAVRLNLSAIAVTGGRLQEAQFWMDESIRRSDKAKGPAREIIVLMLQGRIAHLAQDYVTAEKAYRQAETLRREHLPNHIEARSSIAQFWIHSLIELGRLDEARLVYQTSDPASMPMAFYRTRELAKRRIAYAHLLSARGQGDLAAAQAAIAIDELKRLSNSSGELIWARLLSGRFLSHSNPHIARALLSDAREDAQRTDGYGDLANLATSALNDLAPDASDK